MAMTWTEQALSSLHAVTGRSGGARRAVVEFLGRQDCCVSAQEIHDKLRIGPTSVGIASVYRTLESLDDLGLVQRVDLGDGISRFEPNQCGREHHHHLVCDDCGKVEAFEDPALERALERVAGGRGYVVGGHDVLLRGACGDCRAT
jgi:Fur family ferric uptake transcriptional regulator